MLETKKIDQRAYMVKTKTVIWSAAGNLEGEFSCSLIPLCSVGQGAASFGEKCD